MAKLRYNRAFRNGIIAILFSLVLFGSVIIFFVISKIQYDRLVADMVPIEATIIDIDMKVHRRGPNEQEIYITYEVDGVVYNRELKTDTVISFAAGRGAHYSVGDKVEIFYDPQDPAVIASPRSVGVGAFYLVLGLIGLVPVLYALLYIVKKRRKFLVTQEEYEKEKEKRKRDRRERREQRKKKNAKARRILKVIGLVLAVPVGVFILFLLWGALLKALGY